MWSPHVTVACIVERDGRFLMVEELVNGQLVLNQPAGHLDPGESLVEAAARETLEETAWTVRPDAVVNCCFLQAPEERVSYFRVCFAATPLEHDSVRELDKEIVRAVWLSEAELTAAHDRHRSPSVAQCLSDYLGGRRYPLSFLQQFSI